MYCQECGTKIADGNRRYTSCGKVLHDDLYAGGDAGYSGLVPYKNPPALTSDDLGIFSFIPVLGMLLGPIAFILGLKGLRRAREHPGSKGTVHAWVGIICGALFGFGQWLLVLLLWLRR